MARAPRHSCWSASPSSSSAITGLAAKAFDAVGGVKDVEAGVRYRALAGLGLCARAAQRPAWRPRGVPVGREQQPDATLSDWARDRAQAVKNLLGRPPAGPGKGGGKP